MTALASSFPAGLRNTPPWKISCGSRARRRFVMNRPKRKILLGLLVTLGLGGCNYYYDKVPSPDDLMHIVPWFDAMIGSPAVYPYEFANVPRYTVPGTVPVTGPGERDYEA